MSLPFARSLRHALVSLAMLTTAACSQGRDEFVYDMVAEISGGSDIDHVAVRFVDIPFYWEWGVLGEDGWKSYSDIEPRKVPKSLVLSWQKDGEKFEVPFEIQSPPPELLESVRNGGVEINGHVFKSNLELRFEISPDQNTARVYWREDKMPAASPPKDDPSGPSPDDGI